ncbi:MFS transporter [Nocardioides mangrovicus]|uniref:MFS transporter n=1 Tax=Nocardioides mangrovicus TaxID=2478913 RepID=A0A3L8NXZ6_9ACTN|nr:MFS transporter [Nocardioides mangrovicus]RLV47562.1 MFS transporter [Nocardioides mangrovicus]
MSSGPSTKTPLRAFWHDLPREGRLLLSIVVVEFIGTGLVLPFWVVYLHEVRGFSLATTGLLIGVQPLAGLIAAVPGGGLIDRIGARLVLVGSTTLVLVGEAVMAFASTAPLAALGFALSGCAFGVSFPASQTLVATIMPSHLRQRYYGLNFSLLNLGIGVGGIVGGAFVDVHRLWTFQTIYLVDAATFLAPLFVLLVPLRHVTGRAEHDEAETTKPSYREVARLPGMRTMVLLNFVASFVAYAQLNSGMPAFARDVAHVSTQGLGLAFAANTLVIVLLQLVVLQRIEGRRRTRVMVVMSAVWALSWVLMGASGLVPDTWGATVLIATCASVFALGETLLQPTMPAITNDLTTDRLRGRSNALASIAFQVPMVLAPPISGWLIGHHQQVPYVVGLVVGCGLVALLAVTRLEPLLSPTANGVGVRGPLDDPPPGTAADALRESAGQP